MYTEQKRNVPPCIFSETRKGYIYIFSAKICYFIRNWILSHRIWLANKKYVKNCNVQGYRFSTYLHIAALFGKFFQFGVELLQTFLQIVDTLITEIISTDELGLSVLNVTEHVADILVLFC